MGQPIQMLGGFLERKRRVLGISARQLSDAMDSAGNYVDPSNISRWEKARVSPRLENVGPLARALRIDPRAIIEFLEIAKLTSRCAVPTSVRCDPAHLVEDSIGLWRAGHPAEAGAFFAEVLQRAPFPERRWLSRDLSVLQMALAYMVARLGRLHLAGDLARDLIQYSAEPAQRLVGCVILAQCSRDLGLFEEARLNLMAAVGLLSEIPEREAARMRPRILMNEAGLLTHKVAMRAVHRDSRGVHDSDAKGDLLKADGLYASAQRLMADDPYHEVLLKNGRAAVILVLDPRSARASALLKSTVRQAEQRGYNRLLGMAHCNLGCAAFRSERFEAARSCFRDAQEALPAVGHDDIRFLIRFYSWRMSKIDGKENARRASWSALKRVAMEERSSPEMWMFREAYDEEERHASGIPRDVPNRLDSGGSPGWSSIGQIEAES